MIKPFGQPSLSIDSAGFISCHIGERDILSLVEMTNMSKIQSAAGGCQVVFVIGSLLSALIMNWSVILCISYS